MTIKNLGTQTWPAAGPHHASFYHWNPLRKIETPSLFADPSWPTKKQALILPHDVKPGETLGLSFALHAPAVNGTYHESFTLAVENLAWVKFGTVNMDVRVHGGTDIAQTPTAARALTPAEPPAPSGKTLPADPSWSAVLVSQGGLEWQMDPDNQTTVELVFKNTGTQTWTRDGKNYVSVYATKADHERQSMFHEAHWLSATQIVRLREATVAPGELGHFRVILQAPEKAGQFREQFSLAAENTAWIHGGSAFLPIRVLPTTEFIATALPDLGLTPIMQTSADPASVAQTGGLYSSVLVLHSANQLALKGNGRQQLTYAFKNVGTMTWNSLGVRVKGVHSASVGGANLVQDTSWYSPIEPVHLLGTTYPGQVGYVNFQIKAPPEKGEYRASFQLYANEQAVDGGQIDIPISVTADGLTPLPAATSTPHQPTATPAGPSSAALTAPLINAQPLNGDTSSLPNEPIIRVGLFQTTDDRLVVRASAGPLSVLLHAASVCHLSLNETASVQYDRSAGLYRLSGTGCSGTSSEPYLFHADDGVAPMEISDYARPISWLPGANDNLFRGQLELRYTQASKTAWVINELPVEWYLKGIGETSNSSPPEFQRTLLTAARTYAMWHIQRASKHADESFTVDAKYDQVYRGYGAEKRDPNVVAAVDATRGQVVTYQNKLVITPYYSRSDGRTRDWTEVWGGGPYPWLVSVPVPWDNGKTLWGHGVGMSATGALGMANDGKNYQEILKYFYQGTELRKAYK